jgi:hypothetical protein
VATVPGRYLIVDTGVEPPVLTTTDDLLPTFIADALAGIDAKLGTLMSMAAAEQGQIQTLADGMNAVSDQLTAASAGLAQWIADNQAAPLDFTPALNALASVQAAGGVVAGLQPQAPSDPIQPLPAPPDPATDPSTPVSDPNTPDPTLPPGGDIGTATDPTTTPGNGGDTGVVPPDVPPDQSAPDPLA